MPNLVLYRKYRPLKFADVINQEHVKTTLQNAIINGRLGHAYLFTGPRGVGKTTLARILSRAVNCPNRKGAEPCNECDVCRQFLLNTSLDFMEIDAASHTSVENVRDLIEHLAYAPSQASYKVIVIDEVHMLSKAAFNALLKTLEEPPKHAVFILATTEIYKVPPTIISRTQRFDFKKISIADLMRLLKHVVEDNKMTITDAALGEIAAGADGSFRDGLSLLDQVISYSEGQITEELVGQVLGLTAGKTLGHLLDLIILGNPKQAIDYISDLISNGVDIYRLQKDFLEYLRKVLLQKIGSHDLESSAELTSRLKVQAEKLPLNRLTNIIEAFQKAGSELKWSSIPSLPIELAVVEVTGDRESGIPEPDAKQWYGAGTNQESGNKTKQETKDELHPAPSNHPRGEGQESNRGSNQDSRLRTRDGQAAPDQARVGNGSEDEQLQLILDHWPQILEKVKEYNHSLISSLKISRPVAVVGKELILAFPYKFHKDSIEARKNRVVVDQVLEDVLGIKLMTKPIMQKDWDEKNYNHDNNDNKKLVESALKIIGGEIEKE